MDCETTEIEGCNPAVGPSRSCTALFRSYGVRQEFITPHRPKQNGIGSMVL